ncbi:MAG: glycosyltransferase family 2 protein [Geobacteraceae bacterium]
MPKVSVIIPCYNQGIYLDEAIDSVLDQTYEDFEIIIVNDGSTDEFTNRLLTDYRKPRTRVLQTRNQGLATARNSGIAEARGEFILPLDADDKIGAGYLEQGVALLEHQPKVGIVYCRGELFGGRTGEIAAPPFSRLGMLASNLIFCSALFRKADWQRVGGYNPDMIHGCEDWDFWLSLLEQGLSVARLPEVFFYYRVRESSMNQNMDKNKRREMFRRIVANHPRLYRGWHGLLGKLGFGLTQSRYYRLIKEYR